MANKMADKKKNASQTRQTRQTGQARQTSRASQASQMVEPEAKGVEREKEQSKASKAAAREREERKEKTPRRETKTSAPTIQSNLRKNAAIRFFLESYYELRHKVTWPTFEEARNMTIAVLALSVVIGIILGVADFGLLHLYQLIAK